MITEFLVLLSCNRQKMFNEITEEIRLREVFYTETPNTTFASAALVLPYPHGIFSVWAILISLTNNK